MTIKYNHAPSAPPRRSVVESLIVSIFVAIAAISVLWFLYQEIGYLFGGAHGI